MLWRLGTKSLPPCVFRNIKGEFSTLKLSNVKQNCTISSLIIAHPPAKRFKITLIVKRCWQWSRAPPNIVPLLIFITKSSESYNTLNVTNIIHQFYCIFYRKDESNNALKVLKLHYFTAVHSLLIRTKQHASQLLWYRYIVDVYIYIHIHAHKVTYHTVRNGNMKAFKIPK